MTPSWLKRPPGASPHKSTKQWSHEVYIIELARSLKLSWNTNYPVGIWILVVATVYHTVAATGVFRNTCLISSKKHQSKSWNTETRKMLDVVVCCHAFITLPGWQVLCTLVGPKLKVGKVKSAQDFYKDFTKILQRAWLASRGEHQLWWSLFLWPGLGNDQAKAAAAGWRMMTHDARCRSHLPWFVWGPGMVEVAVHARPSPSKTEATNIHNCWALDPRILQSLNSLGKPWQTNISCQQCQLLA